METLATETENYVDSDIYVSLGIKQLGKGALKVPRALSLLSSLLERSVQRNDTQLNASSESEVFTIFHGRRPPALSIQQYVNRIFKYSCCSPSCFVLAKIYLDRFLHNTDARLTSLNVHRLLITSVMLAAKFMDDAFFNNAYYAKVGGVTTTELNRLEMRFLFGIDFRLQVSTETFGRYCLQLEKVCEQGLEQIEGTMKAFGINDIWSSKDDSGYAPRMAR